MIGDYDGNEAVFPLISVYLIRIKFTFIHMSQANVAPNIMSTDIPHLSQSIALVGLMGAGKSKIGKALGEVFTAPFIDTDDVIEDIASMTIPTIFELYGEEKFREIEAREIKKLATAKPVILSTGGGAFIHDKTRAIIKNNTVSVWLKAGPVTLAGRISNTASRPLLRGRDPVEVLTELSKSRNAYYQEAHIIIDTDGLSLTNAIKKVTGVMVKTFANTDGLSLG